jgi:Zn-dependent protease
MLNLDPATLIAYAVVLLIAFPVHEFAHAWTATQFGDETPRRYGRLTLNPLAHLDVMGSLMLLFAGFGWAKPVPVNPYALERRYPSAYMWVSLAGPLSNLLLAILASIPVRLGLVSVMAGFIPSTGIFPSFDKIMVLFVYTNLVLLFFNLIPLAPLDGEKVASYLLPPNLGRYFDMIRPYGPVILLALFAVGSLGGFNILSWLISQPVQSFFLLLVG